MQELFVSYLRNSLNLSIVALLIIAFSPLLSRRYSAKCRYYLWVVVFAALLLPIRPQINVALPEFLKTILPSNATGVPTILPSDTPTSGTMQISNATNIWDWLQYAVLLWGVGMVFFIGWHTFQHIRFLSAVKRWSEDIKDTAILELFTRTKSELDIHDNIILKSCACIKTPMLIGLLRPVVLIPQSSFHQDELPLILKHELVHHKRKDLWYKVLMMLVLSIHWFNPAVHLMVKSALNLCEMSCDEEVLKEIDTKGRAKYGESIIGIIQNGSAYQTALSTNFYSSAKGMKQRIYAMMDMTGKRFSPVLFFAILIITLCGATTFAISSAQEKDMMITSNSINKDIVDSGLSNTEIQPSQGISVSDANGSTAARPKISDSYLPANETATRNDSEYPKLDSEFVIVSQETKNELLEKTGSSLIGLYCYDENGGVKMTSEMVAALRNAH